MNQKMLCRKVFALFLLFFSMTSCLKIDEDDFDFDKIGIQDHDVSWVANLLDVEAPIGDFVSDSIISGASLTIRPNDKAILLSYQLDYQTDTIDIREWIKVDTLSGKQVLHISNPSFPLESYTDVEVALKFPFIKVDTVALKSGTLEFWINTPLDTTNISAEFQCNVLLEKRNGLMFTYVQKLHFGKNNIDLKDKYLIVNDSNLVRAKVFYKAVPFTGRYADSSRGPLYLDYFLRVPDFYYLTGEIYKDTAIELASEKNEFSLLPGKMDVQLHLNNLSLLTDVATNVGIPMECEMSHLKFQNNLNGRKYDFLSTGKYQFKINVPKHRGMTAHTLDTLKINKNATLSNNGNFDFSVYAKLKKGRFFIDENARFDVHARLEFPIDITIEQFCYRDTFAFSSLSRIDSTLNNSEWDFVKSVMFRYEFINGIPLDLAVQVFFTDSSYHVLDSLFEHRLTLKGAQLNPTTALVSSKMSTGPQYLTLHKDRVVNLASTQFLRVEAAATTTQSQRAILAADQTLRLRMGAKVNLSVNYRK